MKKVILWSVGGVVGATATFFAGYFTGRAIERKNNPQVRRERQPVHEQHAQA